MPAWRPGRYLIQNYAANVSQWRAESDGEDLDVEKTEKSTWQIRASAGARITFSYRYYAGVLDAGSSFLDETEAYFNGSNLFMMVEGLRNEESRLSIAAPAEWRIETQLPREDENTFVARDYDHLIDSPTIAAARMTRYTFNESGAIIHLVFVNDEHIETDQFVEPVRAIVREQARMFGGLPLREYRFLIHIGDKWHGVEHEASCSIVAKRSDLFTEKAFNEMIEMCSHEFFHLWNVKRMLPAVFAPYDYSRETYTRLLWVMEGTTSYYGELTLARAGLWSETEYLKHLGDEIEIVENAPAHETLSLSQSSFDAWLVTDMHDRSNAFVSFYERGAIVSAMLDLLMRAEGSSLDEVMLRLWREQRPLEEDTFERTVQSVCDVGDFFERYVHGNEPLPYRELFEAVGIAFESASRDDAPSLAATLRSDGGRLLVVTALRGGAAMRAGLLPGDEIVSIDRTRTTTEVEARNVLRAIDVGTAVEMIVSRAGVIRTMTVMAAPDPRVKITLQPAGESALRDRWLRRPDA